MLSIEVIVLFMVAVFLLGTALALLAFIFTVGLLLERQILCHFFRFHSYYPPTAHNDVYHTQAKICRYCSKIKWI